MGVELSNEVSHQCWEITAQQSRAMPPAPLKSKRYTGKEVWGQRDWSSGGAENGVGSRLTGYVVGSIDVNVVMTMQH